MISLELQAHDSGVWGGLFALKNRLLLTILFLCLSAIASVQAQSFTVLYEFRGKGDGKDPVAGPIRDAAGDLYGTTMQGGSFRLRNRLRD